MELTCEEIQPERVGYVLCVEKPIMDTMLIDSRDHLLQLIKEEGIVDFRSHQRKLIVVDQGEKMLWDHMLQKNQLKSLSYYVHAHFLENHIYLKLNQVVDTTEFNDEIRQSSTIFITDKLIAIRNMYEQISQALWDHIQVFAEKKPNNSTHMKGNSNPDFRKFSEEIIKFFKEVMLNCEIVHLHLIN